MHQDDTDDIIEIDFDDEDGEAIDDTAVGDVLEVVLDDSAEPPSTPRPAAPIRRPRRRIAADVEETVAEPGPRSCPTCGFAIPPLETECPRCARLGPAAAPREQAGGGEDGGLPPVDAGYPAPSAPRGRAGVIVGTVAVIMVVIGAAALTAYFIVNNPRHRARQAFEAGVRAQLAGDMETAREKYREALDLDPDMGLAAYSMGTTFLGLSLSGGTQAYMQRLLEMAAAGDTRALTEADRWFDHTILIANRLPPTRSLRHADIKTPAQLASYAHVMKAITAYIRYAAGLMSEDPLSGAGWLTVMQSELQQAFALDPANPYARDMQNQLPPL